MEITCCSGSRKKLVAKKAIVCVQGSNLTYYIHNGEPGKLNMKYMQHIPKMSSDKKALGLDGNFHFDGARFTGTVIFLGAPVSALPMTTMSNYFINHCSPPFLF